MTEAHPVERVDTPIPEPPSVPGDGAATDGTADALPDVLKLAEECLEDLREHVQSEGWTLEPGWRCEVKLRAKLTAVGPRSDKYFFSPEGKMFRSNAEVLRHFNDRRELELLALNPPTKRTRPPPKAREPPPETALSDLLSDDEDEADDEDEDEEELSRGRKKSRGGSGKKGKRGGSGKDGASTKPATPVNSEDQVKRYLYRTNKGKGPFGPFSLADLRGWRESFKQKGVYATLKVFTLRQSEDEAVLLSTLLGD